MERLENFAPQTPLMAGRSTGSLSDQGNRYAEERLTLTASQSEGLRSLTEAYRLEPITLVQGAWALLLSRYSCRREVVFGAAVSGRPSALSGAAPLIGPLNALLPVRACAPRTACAVSWLKDLQARVDEIRDYAYIPLSSIKAWNGIAPSQTLFESAVIVDPCPVDKRQLRAGIEVIDIDSVGQPPAPLTLEMLEGADLALRIRYDESRFDAASIRRMLAYLQTLLEAITLEPDRSIESLPLLTAREAELIARSNDTDTDYPRGECIHTLFEAQAERTPDAIAVVFQGERLTYRDLNRRANQLAHHLRSLCVGPEVRVGICLERSFEMIVGMLGILKAGGVFVPLDPSYPLERLAFMLEDVQPLVLLTMERFLDELPTYWGATVCLDSDWEMIAERRDDNPVCDAVPENLAYVMYTSGSTGRPKGVSVPHRGVVRLVRETNYVDLGGEEALLQVSPFTFDGSTFEIWGALLNGGRVVVMPPNKASLEDLRSIITENGVTTVFLTTALFHLMVDEQMEVLAWLKQLLFGGEVLSVAHAKRAIESLGRCRLLHVYGPTEGTTYTTFHEMNRRDEVSDSVPIGKPIANTCVYILDEELRPVPVGVPGELYTGGDGLARCYFNRPELTAERFIPDPCSGVAGARLYRAGDLARWLDDGSIDFLGRIDDQVKIRGFRIEPAEIEASLKQHPDVREAAVIAEQGEREGEGKRLVAYVAADETVNIVKLRSYLAKKLPDYMIPSTFVLLDELPLNPNGKVDRNALPRSYGTRPEIEEEFIAPRTSVERALADVWSQVLSIEKVGIHDNFFALGADSIRSIQVIALARQRGLEITLQQVFQHQTIYELARQVAVPQEIEADCRTKPFELLSEEDRQKLPPDIEDAYPLTRLQAGMLFHSEYQPDSAIYHDVFSYHLRAPFNPDALRLSAERLAARHAVLRTSFDLTGLSEPVQLVNRSVEIPLEFEDLRTLDPVERDEVIVRWIESEKGRRFDWTQAPLVRLQVHRRTEETFQFTISLHHAILDGWSLASLFTELFQYYFSLLGLRDAVVDPPPVTSYRDFVVLERQACQSEECRRYWAGVLRDSTVALLPRWPGLASTAERLRVREVRISSDVSRGLKRAAIGAGVSVKSVLLAAHMRVLSLLTGQSDVMSGLVCNGRPEQEDGDRAIGLFLNTLPFRLRLSGGSWRDLIEETFKAEQALLPYRRYPLAEIQKNWRDQPLFEVVFNFIHFHIYNNLLDFDGLEFLGGHFFEETNFTLLAEFYQDPSLFDVVLSLKYDATILSPEQIELVAGYYKAALTAIARDPLEEYASASLLSERERSQLLVVWNEMTTGANAGCCPHELFERQVAHSPEAAAIIFGSERLSYRELNDKADHLARHLVSLGVGPEVLVGVCSSRSIEMVVGLLGILKAGGAYVPLDPNYPGERLAFMLSDACIDILLTEERLLGAAAGFKGRTVCLDADWDLIASHKRERQGMDVSPGNLAYVIYTSGSTGRPKGIAIEHSNASALIDWARATFTADQLAGVLASTSICFDLSVFELFVPLACGGTVILAENALHLPEIESAESVTLINTVPSAMAELLRIDGLPSSARTVNLAGEPLKRKLVDEIYETQTVESVYNLYGPAEDTTYSTCALIGRGDRQPPPIGRPLANKQIYLLDSELQPVPVGVKGEIYIGGRGVARGYLNRPDLTAERFTPDPFGSKRGERLYRTGDLGRYLPDGNIEYIGRIDHQVKIRGFRIEPGEIEAVLSQHPWLRESAVVVCEDESGEKRLAAYVSAQQEPAPTATELRNYLRERLPDYMIPAVFVTLSELPLNPNGKLDRSALPAPDQRRPELDKRLIAPITPVENIVADIWSQALNLAQVGVEDNFFELGGHSLLATQIISRLRQVFQVDLPISSIFDFPTVARLSERIERAMRAGDGRPAPPITPRPRAGLAPASFAQQRLWLLHQVQPDSTLYNIPTAIRLRGPLDIDALNQTVEEVLRRHESLRTTFISVEGRPCQVVAPHKSLRIPEIDLQELAESAREEVVYEMARKESLIPFDLTEGPLARVSLLKFGQTDHVLLLTVHHIVFDGWSMGVLMREMASLYDAFSKGLPSPMPDLAVQYSDYSIWQREWLEGEHLESQLRYWRRQLDGSPTLSPMPIDRPRPPVQSFQGARHSFVIPGSLAEPLRALGSKEGATLYMTLLAVFKAMLCYQLNQDDIVVGTEVANRTQAETEGMIGFFVNELVLRTNLAGNPTFREMLGRARRVALGAYAHQDLPFDRLVAALKPERDLSHNPFFQVTFVIQDAPASPVETGGLTLSRLLLDRETSVFDLTLYVIQEEGSLSCGFLYNTDIFEPASIARLVRHYELLLSEVVARPDARLTSLFDSLAESDRQQQARVEKEMEEVSYEKLRKLRWKGV